MWMGVDVKWVKIIYFDLNMCFFFCIFLSTHFKQVVKLWAFVFREGVLLEIWLWNNPTLALVYWILELLKGLEQEEGSWVAGGGQWRSGPGLKEVVVLWVCSWCELRCLGLDNRISAGGENWRGFPECFAHFKILRHFHISKGCIVN